VVSVVIPSKEEAMKQRGPWQLRVVAPALATLIGALTALPAAAAEKSAKKELGGSNRTRRSST
jgi:hypothetical protein